MSPFQPDPTPADGFLSLIPVQRQSQADSQPQDGIQLGPAQGKRSRSPFLRLELGYVFPPFQDFPERTFVHRHLFYADRAPAIW